MPVYQYRVKDRSGKELRAQMEADTIHQVRETLRSRNMMILDIKEPAKGMNAEIKIPGLSNRPPDLKSITIFSRQMATLINAGVPLVQSLSIMERQIENGTLKDVVKKLRIDVETGLPLSEGMAKHPRVFNRLYLNLVRAGETSGMLDQILDRVSAFQEKDLALRGKIKKALTYPTVVSIAAVLITYGLIRFVVPTFGQILTGMNAPLPFITKALMALADFFEHSSLWLFAGAGAIYFAYKTYYATPSGRRAIDAIKLKMPVFGSLTQKTAIASFTRTLGILITSGVNIIESLEITKGTADNAVVEEAIDNAKNVVTVGEPLSGGLAASPVFPPMVLSMISIGEETGALDNMLNKIADFYDREVDEAVDSLTAVIEPIMIVFLGGVVLIIMLGMFLPMFAIMGELSK
ncbi:type II secretion system F family protein [Deinococcus lacus]|uniref:Type II secretion system F family protein n=1 Tax=Deinococcus lacus TaxID=392561 RepID=A0ABW1YAT9_9DEIO